MELREVLDVLRRQWLAIVALTVLGALVAVLVSLAQPRVYTAQATVLLSAAAGQSQSDVNSGATFVERVASTYAELASTSVVLDPAAAQLGLPEGTSLAGSVSASIISGTTFIRVRASWGEPEGAAAAANAVAAQLETAVADLSPRQNGAASLEVSQITPATAPSSPSSPTTRLNTILGAVLGLVAGLGLVVLRSALDARVTSENDTRRVTSAPVLGVVSALRRSRTQIPVRDPWGEDFRRIRTNLRLLDATQRPSSIVVTSCRDDEGRAAVAFNLARTAVEGRLKVCLVEADLRHPHLAADLGLPDGPGLSEVLTGAALVGDALHVVDGIQVMHAGKETAAQPGDLVTSAEMAELLATLMQDYDVVIADAAPLLEVTDAAALGASASGVVLVVGRRRITRDELGEAVGALNLAGAHLLGSVLNDATDVPAQPLARRSTRQPA